MARALLLQFETRFAVARRGALAAEVGGDEAAGKLGRGRRRDLRMRPARGGVARRGLAEGAGDGVVELATGAGGVASPIFGACAGPEAVADAEA